MEKHVQVLFMAVALAPVALAAFAFYSWRQRQRARGIKEWVDGYLRDRFGKPLDRLIVNCSDDTLWPVLVSFDDPRSGLRHRLRFSCFGPPAAFRLVSEETEKR